ncbi:hypothetical protein [Mucilaginibacter aquatilis]|uniref:Uncharacterized protein n=1 Tax=Mucilaginibacter aquatilis TaxID=1517760 RepID=A0A6I4IAA5_9SPHI|nr:hypothetical protein [Mucilaginibacter aquatilis]MVN91867.1 hypothetical protein [Mucilaginibacter aquatilis]
MKALFTLLSLSVCLTAAAQKNSKHDLMESIHDDGKIMHVEISGDVNGKAVNYNKKFDIKGLSTAEKDALTQRIADSLGIKSSHKPVKPIAPNGNGYYTQPPVPPAPPTPPNALHIRTRDIKSSINDDGDTMYLKFNGTYNDKPVKYERIFDVKGKTAQEKNDLIKSITDSLGISNQVKIHLSK